MGAVTTVDQIQYLFTFPFRDERWKRKFLVGGLLTLAGFLLPVIPWIFLSGYIGRIIQSAIQTDREPALPEWEDWNDLFFQGLRLTLVGMVAFLPVLLVFLSGYAAFMAPAFLTSFSSSTGEELSLEVILAPFVGAFGGMGLFGVSIFLALGLSVLLPPALGHVVATGQGSAAIRLGEWWPIFRANLGGYGISCVVMMGTLFIWTYAFQLLYLTIVLCCTLPFVSGFLSVYLGVVGGVLFGQAYRVGKEKLDRSIERPAGEMG